MADYLTVKVKTSATDGADLHPPGAPTLSLRTSAPPHFGGDVHSPGLRKWIEAELILSVAFICGWEFSATNAVRGSVTTLQNRVTSDTKIQEAVPE